MRERPSLRARFYGEVPPHPFDSLCDRSLLTLAVLAWTSSIPLLQSLFETSWWQAALIPLYLVIFLPHLLQSAKSFAKKRGQSFPTGVVRTLATIPLLMVVYGLPIGKDLGFEPIGLLLIGLAYGHGSLLPRAKRVGTAILAAFAPLLIAIAVLGMANGPSWAFFLALPVLPGTLAVALLLQARNHDRQQSARPLVIPGPIASSSDLSLRAGLGLFIGSLFLSLLLLSPEKIVAPFVSKEPARVGQAKQEPQAGMVRSLPPLDDPTEVRSPKVPPPPARPVMPEQVSYDGRMMDSSPRPWRTIFQVRSKLDRRGPFFGEDRPLYLRIHTYDRIEESGLSMSPGAVDVLYGTPSGAGEWSWLELTKEFYDNDAVEFEWQGFPIRGAANRGRSDLALLMHRAPVMAIQVPELHRQPGGTLATSVAEPDSFVYRWINREQVATAEVFDADTDPEALPRTSAASLVSSVDYLQLPASSELQPWLNQTRREVGELVNPKRKIAAVLDRYRDYQYSRVVGEKQGFASLLDFREKQRGYCTYFATAVALELRAVGIPCRLVGGFRLTRWSSKVQAYLGSEREAHLWVEVPNQDGQWVALEATPPGNLAALLNLDLEAAEDAAAKERIEIAATAKAAAEEEAEAKRAENQRLPPAANGEELERVHPRPLIFDWLPRAAIAVAFLFAAFHLQKLLKFRFTQQARLAEEARAAHEARVIMPPTWLALMEHLAEEGLERESTETMTEFARVAVEEGVEQAFRLVPVFQRQQRFRFGDRQWSEQDERETRALLNHLRKREEAS